MLTCPPYFARETNFNRDTLVETYRGMPAYASSDAFLDASARVLARAWRAMPGACGRIILIVNDTMAAGYKARLIPPAFPGISAPEELANSDLAAFGLGVKERVLVWSTDPLWTRQETR